MRLSAKILKNVNNVNSWIYTSQAYLSQGSANSMFVQLVDLDQSNDPTNEKSVAFPQSPIRYMPLGTVLALEATFPNLEDEVRFTVIGSQPFPQDRSIWKFDITSLQNPSSGAVEFKFTEDGVVKTFLVKAAISVNDLNVGGC